MPISGTLTRLTPDRGFTLLELMCSLAIISLALGMGMAYFYAPDAVVEKTARALASSFSRARSEAMLARQPVAVSMEGDAVMLQPMSGPPEKVRTIPGDIRVSIDGKAFMAGTKTRFVFSPLGHTRERLLHLSDAKAAFTLYLPSIGAPVTSPGLRSLEEIRREAS